ncbi:MAG TPA: hypothetical protein GXZ32_06915 [Clostridiales bacterium]|nr:hypothetical protein [Clostridiales bacterium]
MGEVNLNRCSIAGVLQHALNAGGAMIRFGCAAYELNKKVIWMTIITMRISLPAVCR